MKNKLLALSAACLMSAGIAQAQDIKIANTGLLNTGVALKDGNVYVWGDRKNGLAGDGRTTVYGTAPVNVVPLPEEMVTVSGGTAHINALSVSGNLYGWGEGYAGCPGGNNNYVPCLVMQDVAQVSFFNQGGYAIDSDGQLWSWGGNDWRELGVAFNTRFEAVPVPVNLDDEKARLIAGHMGSAIAITTAGHVWVWGSNTEAKLGFWDSNIGGNYIMVYYPTRERSLEPYAHQIVQIGSGHNFTVALLNDGRVIGWGNRASLGVGQTGISPEAVEILSNVEKIHFRVNGVVALTKDGAVYTWGIDNRYALPMLDGYWATMRLAPGSAIDIGGGVDFAYYKTPDGRVYGVGYNGNGTYQITSSFRDSRINWPGEEIELSAMQ